MGKKSLIKSTTKKKTSAPKRKAKEVKPPPDEVIEPEQSAASQETTPAAPEAPDEPTAVPAEPAEIAGEPEPEVASPESELEEAPEATAPESEEKTLETPAAEPVPPSPEPPDRAKTEPEADVKVTYGKGPEPPRKDPMDNFVKIFLGGLALLIVLVVGASATNSNRYFIIKAPAGFDVWKGKFAPLGKRHVIRVVGVEAPQQVKPTYSRNEVSPLIFKYYLNQADALLETGGTPDFDTMKVLLNNAQKYAVTNELSQQADRRLVTIDFNNLLYKADVAASYGDKQGFKSATEYLHQAGRLRLDDLQKALLQKKLEAVKTKKAALEGTQTVTKPKATKPEPSAAGKPEPAPAAGPEAPKSDHYYYRR
jgi:hypothetical protein